MFDNTDKHALKFHEAACHLLVYQDQQRTGTRITK